MPIYKWMVSWAQLCHYLWRRFNDDGCIFRAAALAFTTLLSIVPLLAVSFSILAAFPVFSSISKEIQVFIFKNFVPASGNVISEYLNQFVLNTIHLSLVGSLSLIVTALLLLYSIEQTFNIIWRVDKPRPQLIAFLIYWGLLTMTPILIAIGITASAYFSKLPLILQTTEWLGMGKLLATVTAFLLSSFGFTLLYTVMPHCDVRLRHSIPGGIIAAVLFEIAKQGFAFYISWLSSYQLLYGTLAAIPIFLIWLYVTWLIILFGAEVTHALGRKISS